MNTFKGYKPAPPTQKTQRSAAASGVDMHVPNMKASAQGSLQHKRDMMRKDKARVK